MTTEEKKKKLIYATEECVLCDIAKEQLSEEIDKGEMEIIDIKSDEGKKLVEELKIKKIPVIIKEKEGKVIACGVDFNAEEGKIKITCEGEEKDEKGVECPDCVDLGEVLKGVMCDDIEDEEIKNDCKLYIDEYIASGKRDPDELWDIVEKKVEEWYERKEGGTQGKTQV